MSISNIFVLNFLIALLLSSQFLLVFAQSTSDSTADTSIENRSCDIDWDCVNNATSEMKNPWFNRTITLRLGDFMCIQNKCKFVVVAGQPCRDVQDCAAFHYSGLNNVSLELNDICSSENCNPESKCDGAWDQKDLTLPKFDKPSTCCNGLPSKSKCDIVATDVDPCNYSSDCRYDEQTNGGKCIDVNQKQHIWIGILICLLGGVAANVGLNVQKYAFTKQEESEIKQQMADIIDDDSSSKKNASISNVSTNLERSNLYRKLEPFMFWKQIIVSPLWVIGLAVFIFGSLLGFVALKFAPQSLVAPLGVVSLVVNLIIAPILHNQKLTVWDIVGVVIIICGSVVITVFSGIVVQDYKLCALIGLFHRPQTIIYLSVIGLFIFCVYTFIRVVERNSAREDEIALAQEAANAAGGEKESFESELVNTDGSTDVDIENESLSIRSHLNEEEMTSPSMTTEQENEARVTIVNQEDRPDRITPVLPPRNSISSIRTTRSVIRKRNIKEKILLPLAYAILASSLATITTLFAKSLINLLTVSFTQKDNQFKDFLSWMILLVTVSTAIGQVYWINMGLKKYDALLQVPVFYCNWSLFDIIGGGIYYDEFHHFDTAKYVGFILGICLIFFGVSLLSKRLAKLSKEEELFKEKQKKWEQERKMKLKMKRKSKSKSKSKDGNKSV